MTPHAIMDHLDEFLAHIDVARKTEVTYRYGLQAFAAFLAGSTGQQPAAPKTMTARSLHDDSLTQFRHWMRNERRLSRRSEGTYLAAAIRYVEWLDANSLLEGDITSSQMKLILRNARGRRRVGYKTQPIKEAVPLVIQYYDQLPLPDTSSAAGAPPAPFHAAQSRHRSHAVCHRPAGPGTGLSAAGRLRRRQGRQNPDYRQGRKGTAGRPERRSAKRHPCLPARS